MQRALETARNAVLPLGLQFDIDPDLREIDFGTFEGLTFDEINSRYPEQVSIWTGLDRKFAFPQGEGVACFLERIQKVGSRLASLENDTVIVFTHGGVIRALICYFLGLEPIHYVLFDVDHASVTTIRLFGESGVLSCLNDTCHLRGI
jgi:broad specificity phosphatase PhoE